MVEKSVNDFSLEDPKESKHRLGKLRALSRFQHDTDDWLDGTGIQGRPPIFTIRKEGKQLALWNPRLGRFSFTKACLPLLAESNKFPIVNITPDIDWRGDLFSSNVTDYQGSIRIGDEVLVYQNNQLVGLLEPKPQVGNGQMDPVNWRALNTDCNRNWLFEFAQRLKRGSKSAGYLRSSYGTHAQQRKRN